VAEADRAICIDRRVGHRLAPLRGVRCKCPHSPPIARDDLLVIERIDLADEGYEAPILRAALEFFGGRYDGSVRVGLFLIGRAQHLVDILSNQVDVGDHLVLCGHGDDRGLVVPELAPELEAKEQFHGALTADDLRGLVNLPGRTVVSLGCMTGQNAIAEAFLAGGCVAYVGPTD
jgi:hypothetical protein